MGKDWKALVLEIRSKAEEMRVSHPDAALMRCRKAMEIIQYDLFEVVQGELPTTYIPYEKMMGKKVIGKQIPKPQVIEFKTIQDWGNYGSHYQIDGEPQPKNVDHALGALDNLIKWRYGEVPNLPNKQGFDGLTVRLEKRLGRDHPDTYLLKLIIQAIELTEGKHGWAPLPEVGRKMMELDRGFTLSTKYDELIDVIQEYDWEDDEEMVVEADAFSNELFARKPLGLFDWGTHDDHEHWFVKNIIVGSECTLVCRACESGEYTRGPMPDGDYYCRDCEHPIDSEGECRLGESCSSYSCCSPYDDD